MNQVEDLIQLLYIVKQLYCHNVICIRTHLLYCVFLEIPPLQNFPYTHGSNEVGIHFTVDPLQLQGIIWVKKRNVNVLRKDKSCLKTISD